MKRTQKGSSVRQPWYAGPRVFLFAGAVALFAGTVHAYQLRWSCDDIFITLRYVEHFLDGHGLVYNVGERVEGYTHFLWLLLIALFQWMGFSPVPVVIWMGLGAYALTLVVILRISFALSMSRPLLPFASLALAAHYDFKIWATSGLETSFFTLLIAFSVFTLFFWKQRRQRRLLATGTLLTLAIMTRPDAILFYAVTTLVIAIPLVLRKVSIREFLTEMIIFNGAFLVIFLPYMIWKTVYYGDIFPNTYYAKSGNLNYYGQGMVYLWSYFKAYWSSWIIILAPAFVIRTFKTTVTETLRDRIVHILTDPVSGTVLLGFLSVLAYGIFFIARVGGDFMYARFLHPLIPLLYLTGEIGLRHLFRERLQFLFFLFAALTILILVERNWRERIFLDETQGKRVSFTLNGISDEHWYWTQTEQFGIDPISMNEYLGRQLAGYLRGTNAKVLLRGQASLGYYGKFSVCIENAGLTDSTIARFPLVERGRPGHEKNATIDYLVQRGVHFVFMRTPYDTSMYRHVQFRVGGSWVRAEMFIYDRDLMRHLKTQFPNDVLFVDFESYLDNYLTRISVRTQQDVSRDYARFRDFYFRHSVDSTREQRFAGYLASAPKRVPH